jgi:hypothetical protein
MVLATVLNHHNTRWSVCGGIVVLWFTQRKVTDQRTWAGIKVDLDIVGNKFGGEALLFGTVGLDEQRQWLGDTNGMGMGELDAGTFAESSLTRKRPKGKPNVKPLRRFHNLMF